MFQSFEVRSRPADGPPRLARLRQAIAEAGLTGFLVPRADAHQGEYVAACDERLTWLTGFTGSAGFCAVLEGIAGLFVDGRYRLQVRAQADPVAYTPVDWPEVKLADWLRDHAPSGSRIGFDPWLHTVEEIAKLRAALDGSGIGLIENANLVDAVWTDRPAPPAGRAEAWPDALAGRSAAEKRALVAEALRADGHRAAVLTLPDSLSWLLNIRGSDLPRTPVVQGFAIAHDDGRVEVFAEPSKFDGLGGHLGDTVRIAPQELFAETLAQLTGPVRIDPVSAPLAVRLALEAAGVALVEARDPCVLPKALKTAAEIAGARAAHLRDGAAMVEFLAWLDAQADKLAGNPDVRLTEIDVVTALEGFRRATNQLRDISFETIAGAGPNGAIIHYRVSEDSDRQVTPGEMLLVDSGGQYLDGTTDITRTIAIGEVDAEQRACFTRVLQGMIAISRARWPKGLVGRDLDVLARVPLWQAGMDYGHGTGHGVGAYLSVHEGPQRLSRISTEPLLAGMILSNEPGYYREGAFGIRIENLIVVTEAQPIAGGDPARDLHGFETLTFVPIDLRLVVADMLDASEKDWLNAYHAQTRALLSALVSDSARLWLDTATRKL
jgi:Xaa-Pro aminopeptidase